MFVAKTRNSCGFSRAPKKIPCYFPCYQGILDLWVSASGLLTRHTSRLSRCSMGRLAAIHANSIAREHQFHTRGVLAAFGSVVGIKLGGFAQPACVQRIGAK